MSGAANSRQGDPDSSRLNELRSEAALLSQNPEFMRFLDERFGEKATITLEELEAEAS
jgi:hypothetical protein